MKPAILQYIQSLQMGDLDKIVEMFTENGMVRSPLYGDQPARDFYKELLAGTQQSKITLKSIFSSVDNPNIYSAHFKYMWTLRNNTVTSFDCVDVFVFDDLGKIREMTIIYDTYKVRQSFQPLSQIKI